MSTNPTTIPRRERMSKRNQEVYEMCLKEAAPLRARIDELQSALLTANCDKEKAQKRVAEVEEEMNRIIRENWDLEGKLESIKAKKKV